MPHLFTDHFSPDSIKEDSGKKFLQDHAGTSRKLVSPIQELDLRITSEGPDTVFFATTPSRPQTVMYYMKAKRRNLEWSVVHPLNRYTRAAFQAEVWRHNTLAGSMPILTSRIFFKYLLSSTRLVVSDNQPSEYALDSRPGHYLHRVARLVDRSRFRASSPAAISQRGVSGARGVLRSQGEPQPASPTHKSRSVYLSV